MEEIKYLKHKEIDRASWDAVIEADVTKLPYGFSWYLDAVCNQNWDALVLGAYDVILPLPFKRSFYFLGQKQYLQPLFTQQLGPFVKPSIQKPALEHFLESIPASFNLHFNERNPVERFPEGMKVEQRKNFILDLDTGYRQLFKRYKSSLRGRLRKSTTNHQLVADFLSPEELVAIYKEHMQDKVGLKERHYFRILRLIKAAIQHEKGQIWTAVHKSGDIGAFGFFLIHQKRVINLFSGSTSLGYQEHSMHFLLDGVINHYAGRSGWIFDFEGSSIPSIASFFNSFGSIERPYWKVSRC